MSKAEEIELAWKLHRSTKEDRLEMRAGWLITKVEEQGGRCKYCQIPIQIGTLDQNHKATLDHVISKKVGGLDTIENCVAACGPCNSMKGYGTVEELLVKPEFRIRLLEVQMAQAEAA